MPGVSSSRQDAGGPGGLWFPGILSDVAGKISEVLLFYKTGKMPWSLEKRLSILNDYLAQDIPVANKISSRIRYV
jgi:hypothetical protein